VKKFNFSIKTLSKDLNMLPDEVSRNFQLVAKNLAYDTNKIKDQFVKFQTMSQKTGIDIGTLSSQFGGKMDTISGASSAAASINTLLGKNQFSATELLMMDDADRAKSIRDAVMGDKNIMKDIDAGGAQGKFAMLSIAESLNMDTDTARRFIKTGKADSVKNQIGSDIDQRLGKDLSSSKVENFTNGTVKMADAMKQATKEIMRTLGPMRAALLGQRKGFLEKLESDPTTDTTYQELGVTARLGIIPGQGNVEQVTKAMARNPGSQDTIKRLVEAAQMGVMDTGTLTRMLKGLNASDPNDRAEALKAAQAESDVDISALLQDKAKLPAPLISVLARLPSYAARILYREAMALQKGGKIVDKDGSFTSDFSAIITKVKTFQKKRAAMATSLAGSDVAAAKEAQKGLSLKTDASGKTVSTSKNSGVDVAGMEEELEEQIQKDLRTASESKNQLGRPAKAQAPSGDFQVVHIFLSDKEKIPLTKLIVDHTNKTIGRATD